MPYGGFLKPFGDDARFLKWKENTSNSYFKVAAITGKSTGCVQTWLNASRTGVDKNIVPIRTTNGQIKVPTTPDNDDDAASKSYVDSTMGLPKYYTHGVGYVSMADYDTGASVDYELHVPMSFTSNSKSTSSDVYGTLYNLFSAANVAGAGGTGIGPVLLRDKTTGTKELVWCTLERDLTLATSPVIVIILTTSSGEKKFRFKNCSSCSYQSVAFGF